MSLIRSHYTNAYYLIKPVIPRRIQITLRRWVALRTYSRYAHVWPVNAGAARAPAHWKSWPEQKRFALVLTHDVDTARGRNRCEQLAGLEESLGFRSSFNFVAESYRLPSELREGLTGRGFEVGLHGITHRGNPFRSERVFRRQAPKINRYLQSWNAVGFRCPCMYHRMDWIGELTIRYDASTFDTDPFEPQPDSAQTIYPFWVPGDSTRSGFVELPYTLPQDFTLFVLLAERSIDIWKRKLEWIAQCGGMALVITHPDYMSFNGTRMESDEYPAGLYREFLNHLLSRYKGQYWHVLPKEMAHFWAERSCSGRDGEHALQSASGM